MGKRSNYCSDCSDCSAGIENKELMTMLNQYDENIEMHDSALFDVVVEVDFYDGRRIRIPQDRAPEGWVCPF